MDKTLENLRKSYTTIPLFSPPPSDSFIKIKDNKIVLAPGTYNINANNRSETITVTKETSMSYDAESTPLSREDLNKALEAAKGSDMNISESLQQTKLKSEQKELINEQWDLQDAINANMQRIDKQDQAANKILKDLKPGEEISVKDIKKVYGKGWKKSLACTPLAGQVDKRDKKKAKQIKKSRKLNRRRK